MVKGNPPRGTLAKKRGSATDDNVFGFTIGIEVEHRRSLLLTS